MINRIEKWEIHALAIIMLVVTAFFTFSTFCFAADEEIVDYNLTNYGIISSPDHNYFTSNDSVRQGYVQLEKGYIYTFTCTSSSGAFVFCNGVPDLNVIYYDYTVVDANSSYSFIVDDDSEYFVFSCNNPNTPEGNRVLTRRPADNYQSAVGGLVDNVGVNQIWDVFGSGVNFVYVVVIVAFGIFLIALAIRKVSKGKSEF